MTRQQTFKRRIRERMSRTGERYSSARSHLATTRDRIAEEQARLESAYELASDERLTEATGRGWEGWLSILDGWGARPRKHGETVEYLMAGQGVPGWWAQAITNGYERARGLRAKHQQADGFTVYASKTIAVPIDTLFEAFLDPGRREAWLTDGSVALRTSQARRTARFDWNEGPSRLLVTFEEKGPARSSVHVAHERLPDAGEAESAKTLWRLRLTRLKSRLESAAASA